MDAIVYIAGLPFVFVPLLLLAQLAQMASRWLCGHPKRTLWRNALAAAAVMTGLFTIYDLWID